VVDSFTKSAIASLSGPAATNSEEQSSGVIGAAGVNVVPVTSKVLN